MTATLPPPVAPPAVNGHAVNGSTAVASPVNGAPNEEFLKFMGLDVPGLLPHHLKQLEASGLNRQTIIENRIHSETSGAKIGELLNWKRPANKLAPALVFRYDEIYFRLKLDNPRLINGKPAKYESPRGSQNRAYIPVGAKPAIADVNAALLATEGEKKALKATQEGFPCIGLVGVYGWKLPKKEELIPDLAAINWRGRTVYIVFDSDSSTNADVELAQSRLAAALTKQGATVRIVRLPPGPNGEKVGLDDFLVAHGPDEFRKRLESAEEPKPVPPEACKADASEIDPGAEAKGFLAASMEDGMPRYRRWRDEWLCYVDGAYQHRDDSEIRAKLIRDHLDPRYCNLRSGTIGSVVDHLRAHAILSSRTDPGTWIDEPPVDGWEPRDLLVTRNKIIHLPTLIAGGDAIIPATPRLFTRSAIGYEFDPNALRPVRWLNFLNQVWPDDSECIDALQAWMGYLLTPDTRLQKGLMIIGPKRSGKGTISQVIRHLIGPNNVAFPTLTSLAGSFGLAPLIGKSVAIISDARASNKTDSAVTVERVLRITGEDPVDIDRKHMPTITCKLPTRVMLLSNEIPKFADASGALASRFITLSTQESFYGREDHGLLEQLLAELPGILLWAIQGWERLQSVGRIPQPQSGKSLGTELEDLSSPIKAFIREQCTVAPGVEGVEVEVKELFNAYQQWCESKGWRLAPHEQGFGTQLRAALGKLETTQRRHTGTGKRFRVYLGIRFKTEKEIEEESEAIEAEEQQTKARKQVIEKNNSSELKVENTTTNYSLFD